MRVCKESLPGVLRGIQVLVGAFLLTVLAACGGDVARERIAGRWQDSAAEKILEFFEDGRVVATVVLGRMERQYAPVEPQFFGAGKETDQLLSITRANVLPADTIEYDVTRIDKEYAEYAFVDGRRIRIQDIRAGRTLIFFVVSLTEDTLELKGNGTSIVEELWAGKYKRVVEGRPR